MAPTETNESGEAAEPRGALPRIAGYRVMRRLGLGGMAMVYLAVQKSLDREVAIKVMRPARQLDEAQSVRFEHEARIIAKLEHPGIVVIHEVGRTLDGDLYYVMPYLARGDLSARDYRDDEEGLVALLRVLLDALGYAHARGIVHRDVKAENVLFDNADRPQLADFGIALASSAGDMRVTGDGLVIGSSAQMSPEQSRADTIDGRADLYSLGVLAFELLTGDLPYDATDTLALALKHANDPIPRLPANKAHWQWFIDKAMAKRPEHRFRNAQAMQRALEPIARHLRRRKGLVGRVRMILTTSPALLVAVGALISLSLLSLLLAWRPATVPAVAAPVEPAPAEAQASVDLEATATALRLARARAQLAAGDLLAPPAANAAESFLEVIAHDAANTDARAGLADVFAAARPALLDAARDGQRDAFDAQYALLEQTATQAGMRDDPAFAELRAAAAEVAVEHARRRIARHERDAALEWLELAAALGSVGEPWAGLHVTAAALVPAGATIEDRGGPRMQVVPPRLGRSEIPKALLFMREEVSRGDYARFVEQTGHASTRCRNRLSPLRLFDRRDWRDPGFSQSADDPVVCVSIDDARAYADWLGTRSGQRYRLPTRAEWRHAAQAPAARSLSCRHGNVLDRSANASASGARHTCSDGYAFTAPGGRFPANLIGIHDLLGNASEWTLDCGTTSGGRCTQHVVVGLSWRDGADERSNGERTLDGDRGWDDVGFRLVREM